MYISIYLFIKFVNFKFLSTNIEINENNMEYDKSMLKITSDNCEIKYGNFVNNTCSNCIGGVINLENSKFYIRNITGLNNIGGKGGFMAVKDSDDERNLVKFANF